MGEDLPDYLTIAEAAEYLAVGPATVRAWIAAGRLHAVRTPGGKYFRVYRADLLLALRAADERAGGNA